jgi:hypothetical protein
MNGGHVQVGGGCAYKLEGVSMNWKGAHTGWRWHAQVGRCAQDPQGTYRGPRAHTGVPGRMQDP